jgi:hypothetical protein
MKMQGLPLTTESPRMTHPIMTLLATGVPLTLLLDLQHPAGPDSRMIYLLEQPHSGSDAASTGLVSVTAGTVE